MVYLWSKKNLWHRRLEEHGKLRLLLIGDITGMAIVSLQMLYILYKRREEDKKDESAFYFFYCCRIDRYDVVVFVLLCSRLFIIAGILCFVLLLIPSITTSWSSEWSWIENSFINYCWITKFVFVEGILLRIAE